MSSQQSPTPRTGGPELVPAYRYRLRVLRVIDGDTLVARVDLGFETHVVVRLRLAGIDAPET
ncbi:MAG TPA: thermonuclease family protein, partial [Thermopetrobacter sp.]|nr:thermonuclease family protein [Thermopetrobacter sp.]